MVSFKCTESASPQHLALGDLPVGRSMHSKSVQFTGALGVEEPVPSSVFPVAAAALCVRTAFQTPGTCQRAPHLSRTFSSLTSPLSTSAWSLSRSLQQWGGIAVIIPVPSLSHPLPPRQFLLIRKTPLSETLMQSYREVTPLRPQRGGTGRGSPE